MSNLVDDLGQEMLYLPGTAALVQDIDKRMMVVLRDGRTLIGFLRSLDQFANLLLTQTIERIHVRDKYGDIDRGVFLIRGENVVLCGEVDFQNSQFQNLIQVSQEEILQIQVMIWFILLNILFIHYILLISDTNSTPFTRFCTLIIIPCVSPHNKALTLQAEELKEKEEKQKILKKAFQERGVPYYSIDSMADDAFWDFPVPNFLLVSFGGYREDEYSETHESCRVCHWYY